MNIVTGIFYKIYMMLLSLVFSCTYLLFSMASPNFRKMCRAHVSECLVVLHCLYTDSFIIILHAAHL